MKCEDIGAALERDKDAVDSIERRFAHEHLLNCADCRAEVHAGHVLRAEATASIPGPRQGAFERAMLAAARQPESVSSGRRVFWKGVALGGAVAASLLAVLVLSLPRVASPPAGNTPIVSMASNEVRDIHIALQSPEALAEAGIRVVLSGAIGLRGFDGQRELSWSTSLDRGANQLTLPVVAYGPGGGQLMVEVLSGSRRKTFLVDVRTSAAAGAEG
jgi:hypothetical protein